MIRKWFGILTLIAVASLLLITPSCADSSKLISIQVMPNPVVFQGVGARVQFTALGSYLHPPETKDITNEVEWRIDVSYLATINSSGVAVATSVCGAGNVVATVYSNPSDPSNGSAIVGTAAISGVENGTAQCQ
jgi:hypothetical protein